LGQLFTELKRRNVIRVSVAYLVASWVILQVADLVLENIGAPEWVMKAFMLALGLGFLLAIVFSWAYELTPEGIKRERDVDRTQSITHETAHKLDRVTIGLLLFVLVLIGAERFLLPEPTAEEPAEMPTAQVSDKSIAVLAFSDLSAAGDQEYFAEGISEELLNVLAQIPGLKVAGRTSSFAFKDQNRGIREIGEILEVAHILEGSIRTQDDRVRVTAQLVKVDDGYHLFSKNYDRELTDIFAVQDEIAQEIVTALRATILGEQPVVTAKATSVEAYEKYLKARQWIHSRDRELMERSVILLDEALAIDPDYAPALAQKALALMLLSNSDGSYGDIPSALALRMSRPLIDRAISLDPDLAEAHAILGLWYRQSTRDSSEQAIASLRKALAMVPTMPNANNWLATELIGPELHQERIRLYEMVVDNDPLYRPAFNNLTFNYLQTNDTDKAEALIQRVERISGGSPNILAAQGALALSEGRLAEAKELLGEAYDFNRSAGVVRNWYANALAGLGEYDSAAEAAASTSKLFPLVLAGRSDAAQEAFDALELPFFADLELNDIGTWMLMEERPEEFIALLEAQAGDSDDWIDEQPTSNNLWGATHLTNVAFALVAVGREAEAQRALAVARDTLDAQARSGADNNVFWLSKAEYAALTSDFDGMIESLQKSIETGGIGVYGFPSPTLDRYREDPRFVAVENDAISRATAERRKLGLAEI
jgi:TolB-like protein